MELFPAANEEQLSLIKRVIDDCDYFLLIIGGRYGSAVDGMSYTEKEYRYALEKGLPILVFLHKDPMQIPQKHTERTDEGRAKLQQFRDMVSKDKLVQFWSNPDDLARKVLHSMVKLKEQSPAVGWVKASNVMNAQEILTLRKENEELKKQLKEQLMRNAIKAPERTKGLDHGEDTVEIGGSFTYVYLQPPTPTRDYWMSSAKTLEHAMPSTLNDIFCVLAPHMVVKCDRRRVLDILAKYLVSIAKSEIEYDCQIIKNQHGLVRKLELKTVSVYPMNVDTIISTFVELGAIEKRPNHHKPGDIWHEGADFSLTPYGRTILDAMSSRKDLNEKI